jgi:sporulation protein YlmC with PRC-barrel domain
MLNNKKLEAISTKGKDPLKMESFRSYIGKEVISKSGERIGKVHDLRFSGNSVTGIVVRRRLSRLFIDKEFIAGGSGGTIMLSIDPVTMMLGKQVFDADGKKMGKVSKVLRKGSSNTLTAVMVKKRMYSRGIKIPKEDIDVSKKNLILKKVYE